MPKHGKTFGDVVRALVQFLNESERGESSSVASSSSSHRNQSVGPFFDSFSRKTIINNVMQHDAALRMHRLVNKFFGTQ